MPPARAGWHAFCYTGTCVSRWLSTTCASLPLPPRKPLIINHLRRLRPYYTSRSVSSKIVKNLSREVSKSRAKSSQIVKINLSEKWKNPCAKKVFCHTTYMKIDMKQNKTTEIKTRNANTVHQYFTLACMIDGKLINVHTSKSYSYIINLSNDFLQRWKIPFASSWITRVCAGRPLLACHLLG